CASNGDYSSYYYGMDCW
nr:immunoglobulin heavy chain junction region [Mus musculus]